MNVSDEGYSRHALRALKFYIYVFIDNDKFSLDLLTQSQLIIRLYKQPMLDKDCLSHV
jgi:hypothetical protein